MEVEMEEEEKVEKVEEVEVEEGVEEEEKMEGGVEEEEEEENVDVEEEKVEVEEQVEEGVEETFFFSFRPSPPSARWWQATKGCRRCGAMLRLHAGSLPRC